MYNFFPDHFLRTEEGARVSIPFLEDLVNRDEFKAWILWGRTELEHVPYYSTRKQRYAGMNRQEKAQMGTDKAFDHALGTGRGKDGTWHAAMGWRAEVQSGQHPFPTHDDAPERDAEFAAEQTIKNRENLPALRKRLGDLLAELFQRCAPLTKALKQNQPQHADAFPGVNLGVTVIITLLMRVASRATP